MSLEALAALGDRVSCRRSKALRRNEVQFESWCSAPNMVSVDRARELSLVGTKYLTLVSTLSTRIPWLDISTLYMILKTVCHSWVLSHIVEPRYVSDR